MATAMTTAPKLEAGEVASGKLGAGDEEASRASPPRLRSGMGQDGAGWDGAGAGAEAGVGVTQHEEGKGKKPPREVEMATCASAATTEHSPSVTSSCTEAPCYPGRADGLERGGGVGNAKGPGVRNGEAGGEPGGGDGWARHPVTARTSSSSSSSGNDVELGEEDEALLPGHRGWGTGCGASWDPRMGTPSSPGGNPRPGGLPLRASPGDRGRERCISPGRGGCGCSLRGGLGRICGVLSRGRASRAKEGGLAVTGGPGRVVDAGDGRDRGGDAGAPPGARTGDGGQQWRSKGLWYCGAVMLILGSLVNFVSFGFAPQSLLACLGSVQFVSNVVFGKVSGGPRRPRVRSQLPARVTLLPRLGWR